MKRPAEDDDDESYPRQKQSNCGVFNQQTALVHNSKFASSATNVAAGTPVLNGAVSSSNNSSSFSRNHFDSNSKTASDLADHLMDVEDKIAILDCGAQYAKVIDRRIRELCVESEILPLDTPVEIILQNKYKALIITGGPKSVYGIDAPKYDSKLFRCGLPILGICYGYQLINKEFGGTVERSVSRSDGQHDINLDVNCSLFNGLRQVESVLLTHGDMVKNVAKDFTPVAFANSCVAAIANEQQKIYGVQFHPEVDLTPKGQEMFSNFLFRVAGCRKTYTMETRKQICIDEIRRSVKEKKVLLLCSGGVDSTVCAALLNKALGADRVFAVHIDNGFMRKNESLEVHKSLQAIGVNLRVYNLSHSFYYGTTSIRNHETGAITETEPLMRIVEPETKRRIIGDTFIKSFEKVLAELKLNPDEVYLAQGTLRPDLIESASSICSSKADAIKTHHNDTEMVRLLRVKGRVIEPLKDFHKDEVRRLGLELGLPEHLVMRHPFPGPGLAIRILCATEPWMCRDFHETQQALRVIVQFHAFSTEEAHKDNPIFQRFDACLSSHDREQLISWTSMYNLHSTLLPIKSVGVQGDSRTYSYVAALSSDSHPTPWSVFIRLAKLIPRLLFRINRVVYVFGPAVKETALTDITTTLLTSTPIKLAQEADRVAKDVLMRSGHMQSLSQMPIIIVPVHFDRPTPPTAEHPSFLWSVVIRTFITNDFMTGVPAEPGDRIPEKVAEEMALAIAKDVPLISRVMYDLTAKPPGTTEWE